MLSKVGLKNKFQLSEICILKVWQGKYQELLQVIN